MSIELVNESLLNAKSVGDVFQIAGKLATNIGFESIAIVTRVGADQDGMVLGTTHQDWRQTYSANRYADFDPRVAYAAANNTLPKIWGREMYDNYRTEQLFAEAAQYGLRGGIVVPIHRSSGITAVVSANVSVDPTTSSRHSELAEIAPRALMLGLCIESVLFTLISQALPERPRADLTEREIECLLWCARGKSSFDIGAILAISLSTVNFHVANTCRKLDCATRRQAVVVAVQQGLIKP